MAADWKLGSSERSRVAILLAEFGKYLSIWPGSGSGPRARQPTGNHASHRVAAPLSGIDLCGPRGRCGQRHGCSRRTRRWRATYCRPASPAAARLIHGAGRSPQAARKWPISTWLKRRVPGASGSTWDGAGPIGRAQLAGAGSVTRSSEAARRRQRGALWRGCKPAASAARRRLNLARSGGRPALGRL